MRRLRRPPLAKKESAYLNRKAGAIVPGADVESVWKSARRSKTMTSVFRTLRGMTGRRERCMFCEDSRGTTIDHFRPKSRFPKKAFVWRNLMLMCQGCQNRKGDRFEVDAGRRPLLIDPTAEDPWNHLFFETATGNLTARHHPGEAGPDPKGTYTSDERTLCLNDEAVVEGRLRAFRNLRRHVLAFLKSPADGSAEAELMEALRDADDYGLLHWLLEREGGDEPPFVRLRLEHPRAWSALRTLLPR